jgi:hypothetical protein
MFETLQLYVSVRKAGFLMLLIRTPNGPGNAEEFQVLK